MAGECSLDPEIGGESNTRLVAALAAEQHGVVSRAQLVGVGLGRRAIEHRISRGLLHPVHRGVYAVGHTRLPREGFWLAAVLAAGPGAFLGLRSAAALWGIRGTRRSAIEVIGPRLCRRAGIDARRVALARDEVTVERGIPVTTPARTLLDLAQVLAPPQLERAVHEAEYLRLTSPLSLEALLARHKGRRGTAALGAIVDRKRIGAHRTRTDFEAAFLAFLDDHDLPRPQRTNVYVAGHEVDAVWPDEQLIVELDSRQAHATTRAFEEDREKDRHLQIHGYRIARITYRQLQSDQGTIAAQLRALLAGRPRLAL